MLRAAYEKHDHFYVINEKIIVPPDMDGKTCFIRHSERDLLFFVNLWEAWRILRRERPDIILSTGAGPIVPFAIVGRLLGMRTLFIETLTRLQKPSMTGRIVYFLADRVFYQWPALERYFPSGVYGGPLV
jgi:UDP-N-acetylglucosamine:LPS N-acetylglucosamine transferase